MSAVRHSPSRRSSRVYGASAANRVYATWSPTSSARETRPFDYRFDCVLGGHPLDEDVAAALGELREETARLRVFGSYRADREEGWETVAA